MREVGKEAREEAYAGRNCQLCPHCVHGLCVVSNLTTPGHPDGVLVCRCESENWIGAACDVLRCPLGLPLPTNTSQSQSQKPVPVMCSGGLQGVWRLRPGASYEPYAALAADGGAQGGPQSPFECVCRNGYGGPACEERFCAFPGLSYANASSVCSGRGVCDHTRTTSWRPPSVARDAPAVVKGACDCLPEYTGIACELLQCPRAPPLCPVRPNPP